MLEQRAGFLRPLEPDAVRKPPTLFSITL